MQTAVDRVIRSFFAKHPASLQQPMSKAQSDAVSDDATAFAARLLDNYKGQLACRRLKLD